MVKNTPPRFRERCSGLTASTASVGTGTHWATRPPRFLPLCAYCLRVLWLVVVDVCGGSESQLCTSVLRTVCCAGEAPAGHMAESLEVPEIGTQILRGCHPYTNSVLVLTNILRRMRLTLHMERQTFITALHVSLVRLEQGAFRSAYSSSKDARSMVMVWRRLTLYPSHSLQ